VTRSPARRRSRPSVVAATLLALGLLAAACGGDDDDTASPDTEAASQTGGADDAGGAPDLSGVTLRVGDQVNLAKTLLEASGQLDDAPYDIEWTSFAAGPPLLEAINADAIDIGGVGDTPPIFAQAAGTPFKIVGASQGADDDASSLAIVVPEGSDIEELSDLEGRKLAYTEGSAANYLVLKALEEADLTIEDVEPVPLLPPDGLAAFTGGDVDAWAVWDPFVALAEAQGGSILASGAGLVPGYGFQVARAGALDDEALTAAIGDYLLRLQAAAQWAIDHQDEWAELYAGLTDLEPEVVSKTLDRFQAAYVPLDDDIVAAQQDEADTFFDAGLIPDELDVADIFDTRYADSLSGT
jgi:sulfonate transport system substrate-binding protein